jgi:TusA-related sulfurtransferase
VELMRAIRAVGDGETIEILADDRAFPADVAAWCRKTNNTLISMNRRADAHVAIVKKGSPETC